MILCVYLKVKKILLRYILFKTYTLSKLSIQISFVHIQIIQAVMNISQSADFDDLIRESGHLSTIPSLNSNEIFIHLIFMFKF